MTVIALIEPTDLLGSEMRERLERRKDLWREVRLLTTDDEAMGTLTEMGGGAAIVQRLDSDDLGGVDCAIFCGPVDETRALLTKLDPTTTAIIMSPGANAEDGVPIVAGVNLERARRGDALVSPHPGIVGLANLLAPLLPLRLERASANVLAPASFTGSAGLDEVLDQTRSILAFQSDWPRDVFGSQMAFNVLPRPADEDLGRVVESILTVHGGDDSASDPTGIECTLGAVQVGVFHGCALTAHVRFADDPGLDRVTELLGAHPLIEMVEDPDDLGPIRAAARDEILVGRIEPTASGYSIWSVFDNLTVGGAQNALSILEAIVATEVH